MKSILKVIFLLAPLISFGQMRLSVYPNFEILGKDTINRNIDNQKQGKWIYYKKGIESFSCFTPSTAYHSKTVDHIISKGNYLNGHKVGIWNIFYRNRKIKQTDHYNKVGQRDGISIKYFPSGKIRSKQHWTNDTLVSQLVFFENGHKNFESILKKGKIFSFDIFYKSGKIKFSGIMRTDWKIKELSKFEESGAVKKIQFKQFSRLMMEEDLLLYL